MTINIQLRTLLSDPSPKGAALLAEFVSLVNHRKEWHVVNAREILIPADLMTDSLQTFLCGFDKSEKVGDKILLQVYAWEGSWPRMIQQLVQVRRILTGHTGRRQLRTKHERLARAWLRAHRRYLKLQEEDKGQLLQRIFQLERRLKC